MSVAQVGDLIRLALQELEILPAGDNPSIEEYTDGVDWLNVMLSSWEADESLSMRPNLTTASFNTVASTASYTAGSGGTAFGYRPIRIINAYLVNNGISTPLGIQGKADYNLIQNKTNTGSPRVLYYVPSTIGTIYFDRVPDAAYTITCDLQTPVGDYANQNAALAVSPEYRAAMIYNLAVVLAPSYKANLRPQTVAMAKRSKDLIQYQAHNAQNLQQMPCSDLIV